MKLTDGKNRVKKLEEDNEKLRRALEQSMSRLNRMSVDSDFLVDRLVNEFSKRCWELETLFLEALYEQCLCMFSVEQN